MYSITNWGTAAPALPRHMPKAPRYTARERVGGANASRNRSRRARSAPRSVPHPLSPDPLLLPAGPDIRDAHQAPRKIGSATALWAMVRAQTQTWRTSHVAPHIHAVPRPLPDGADCEWVIVIECALSLEKLLAVPVPTFVFPRCTFSFSEKPVPRGASRLADPGRLCRPSVLVLVLDRLPAELFC